MQSIREFVPFWGSFTEPVAAASVLNPQEPIDSYFQQTTKINSELFSSAVNFQVESLISLVWRGNLN